MWVWVLLGGLGSCELDSGREHLAAALHQVLSRFSSQQPLRLPVLTLLGWVSGLVVGLSSLCSFAL